MARLPTSTDVSTGTFRPKARILQLLGDELIGSPRLAVFELVKNAYDADARKVIVKLEKLNSPNAQIIVHDNGLGMTADTIRDVWLTPANDHRRTQRDAGKRSPMGRLPLGEKGLGRFAIHKLGDHIRMITRPPGGREVVVELDWDEMLAHDFLDEVRIPIQIRNPIKFPGKRHGTFIEITKVRSKWMRGELRDLHRSLTSIADPTGGPSDFSVELRLPGNETLIEDLPNASEILKLALWDFSFIFDGREIAWTYRFRPYGGIKVEPAELTGREALLRPRDRKRVVADASMIDGIGPVSGSFHVFDRDRETWNLLPQKKLVADYLKSNGGVRVFRDGIRVYNYGEPDDDWLGLDLRRVQTPTRNISRNIILGRVSVGLSESSSLREKTNREGFVENDALERLKEVVLSSMSVLERLRAPHKNALRVALSGSKEPTARSIDAPVSTLKKELENRRLPRLVAMVDDIKREYDQLREIMLNAGTAGLQLSLIFHELERGVRGLVDAIAKRETIEEIGQRTQHLKDLLEGFATLLKKEPRRKQSLVKIAREAMFLNQLRFKRHHVAVDFPLGRGTQPDVTIRASRGLAIGGISNAIDNSIFWTRVRWPDEAPHGAEQRRIWVGSSDAFSEGPALVVADNGPGFSDPPDELVRPFWTRRPGGMGLGLYYANLAMELAGGKLAFPAPKDLDLPEWADGAVVAFVFEGS